MANLEMNFLSPSPDDDKIPDPSLAHPFLCGSDIQDGELYRRMLWSGGTHVGYSQSFGDYMREFEATSPDVILFTAKSAVPVADSVRGWYEVTGKDLPELAYIHANKRLSGPTPGTADMARAEIEEECERLGAYKGARAVVIDQYVQSGNTLRLAKRMLARAGLSLCGTTSRAKWFDEAIGVVDLQNLTSVHADFMTDIGRDAAERFVDERYDEAQ